MLPITDTQHNHQWATALVKAKPKTFSHLDELQTFTPMHGYGLDGLIVQEMYKVLLTVTNKNAKAMLQALQCALLTLSQCAGNTSSTIECAFVHKRTTKRTKAIARYKDRTFNDEQMTRVLDALKECGYVRYEAGFKGQGVPQGLATLWLVDASFTDWLAEHADSLRVVSFSEREECVVMNSDDKGAKLKDYSDDDHTNAIRERILEGNELRTKHTWTYVPLDRDLWERGELRRGRMKKEYRQFTLDDKRVLITPESLLCRRVFKGDFESGGRFYCAAQSLNKAERATIQIDGESTIELDLKSLHPRLLYNLEGLEAPEDCYSANNDDQRKRNKMICMYLINTESRRTAQRAFMADFGGTAAEADHELQGFVDQHPAIAKHFFKSSWKRLQFLDSQLVDAVLAKAVGQERPVLPVHDSFIVKSKDAQWFLKVIVKCYWELTGFEPVVDWI